MQLRPVGRLQFATAATRDDHTGRGHHPRPTASASARSERRGFRSTVGDRSCLLAVQLVHPGMVHRCQESFWRYWRSGRYLPRRAAMEAIHPRSASTLGSIVPSPIQLHYASRPVAAVTSQSGSGPAARLGWRHPTRRILTWCNSPTNSRSRVTDRSNPQKH